MWKILFSLFCFDIFFILVDSAVYIIPKEYADPKPAECADKPGCYRADYDKFLEYNQTYSPINGVNCIQFKCNDDESVQGFTCGVIQPPPNCSLTPVNLSLPYPDCCQRGIYCPPDQDPKDPVPAETSPVDTDPEDSLPRPEPVPAETSPVDTDPEDSLPRPEPVPAETSPVDTDPEDSLPRPEPVPAETSPVDTDPEDSIPNPSNEIIANTDDSNVPQVDEADASNQETDIIPCTIVESPPTDFEDTELSYPATVGTSTIIIEDEENSLSESSSMSSSTSRQSILANF